MMLVEPLHGLTFALLHLACMQMLSVVVPPALAANATSRRTSREGGIRHDPASGCRDSAADEIVIDVGGRDTSSLRAALTVSDAILIPFQPRSVDLWAGVQIAALVAEAREVNDQLRACSFINMADAQGHDNGEALEALKTMVQRP
jgi:hypothetical protein